VVFPCEQAIVAHEIIDRQIGREALLAMNHDEFRFPKDRNMAQDFTSAHAFPEVIELAPARDAVHVGKDLHRWQRNELIVTALPRALDQAPDMEGPLAAVEVGRRPLMKNGPLMSKGLARRNAVEAVDVGAGDGVGHAYYD